MAASTEKCPPSNTPSDLKLSQEHAHHREDIAFNFYLEHDAVALTPHEDRQCLRRVDMVLMPLMFISFGLQYMDKACLTGAALFGIIEELELFEIATINGKATLDLQRYTYTTLIFFWGYLLGIVPGIYLCQRLPIGKYVGATIFLWGGVTVCTAAVKTYTGLLILRFFLGFAEAGVAPAFSLITAMWYKREEQPLRFAVWYSSTGIGTLVGTMILYAIGHIQGTLSPWKYQFMMIGSITALWGLIMFLVLPDNPLKARFLNERMKAIAVKRMRLELTGIENKSIKGNQIREAFRDPKNWLAVSFIFSINLTNGALGGFGSVITTNFGYTQFKSILLLGVVGSIVFLTLLATGLVSVFFRNMRCICAFVCCFPVIAGSVMIWKSTWAIKAVPLWGLFLLGFYPAAHVMILSLISANTAGHTKKAVTAGLLWIAYCASNGVAPLTVRTTEIESHYPTAFKIIITTTSVSIMLITTLYFYLRFENRRRDARTPVEEDPMAETAFLDLTDRQNPYFRYRL